MHRKEWRADAGPRRTTRMKRLQASPLQNARRYRDVWPLYAEHHCHELPCQKQFVIIGTVVCHQQPTEEALLQPVAPVACRRFV